MNAEPTSGFLIEQHEGESWIPVTVALALSSGILCNGFNSASGQAICGIINCATLIVLLLVRPIYLQRWKRAGPVLLLVGMATGWAVFASGFPAMNGALLPRPFAPDFLELGLLSQLAGIAALLCGVIIGGAPRSQRIVIDALIALSCLYLFLGLVMRAAGTDGLLSYWIVEREGRFQGTVGNVNVTAVIAGMVAILALSRLISFLENAKGRQLVGETALRAGLYCFGLLVAMGSAFSTASRFTNLLTGCILIALSVRAFRRRREKLRINWPVPVGTGLFLLLLTAQFTGLLRERLDTLGDGLLMRQKMWAHYLDVAILSPIYGYGWGSFPTINTHFPGTLQFAQAAWSVNSAHNIFLQLWLNGGIPYLLLMLAAFGWGVWQVTKALHKRWTTEDIGMAMAVLLITACSMIDIVLDVPATITIGVFFMGVLWGRALVRLEIDVVGAGSKRAQHERLIGRRLAR